MNTDVDWIRSAGSGLAILNRIDWTCCPSCPTPVVKGPNGTYAEAILTLDGARTGAVHVCKESAK